MERLRLYVAGRGLPRPGGDTTLLDSVFEAQGLPSRVSLGELLGPKPRIQPLRHLSVYFGLEGLELDGGGPRGRVGRPEQQRRVLCPSVSESAAAIPARS